MAELKITSPHFIPFLLQQIPEANDPLVIINRLSELARLDGFDLCRVSINQVPIKLYCSKGGRTYGKTSNKTKCPFQMKIVLQTITNEDGTNQSVFSLSFDADQLYHNHELTLTPDQVLSQLDANTEASIQAMLSENIHPQIIKKVIQKLGLNACTSTHIKLLRHSIVNENDPRSETDQ